MANLTKINWDHQEYEIREFDNGVFDKATGKYIPNIIKILCVPDNEDKGPNRGGDAFNKE